MNTKSIPPKDTVIREFTHPMRALPWARKLPDTLAVALMLTAIFSLVSAILFALIGPFPRSPREFGEHFSTSLVYSLSIGYSIHLLSHLTVTRIRLRLADRPFAFRLLVNICVWILGLLLGFVIAGLLTNHTLRETNYAFPVAFTITIVGAISTGLVLHQQNSKALRGERERAERSETQRTLAVSRLRLLQAQIEPHFLFNTLANVSSLIEGDPAQARKMLDQFTLLLRASLDQTRKETTKLGAEVQVVDAYLSVLKVRMGDRLTYSVDAPPELLNVEVPAMLLQPIVENAVKHGIEPRVKGGNVRVDVRRAGDSLIFTVADDGVGFLPNRDENIGLGAVRERLAVQFGAAAALEIERTPGNWTCVTIRIPLAISSATK